MLYLKPFAKHNYYFAVVKTETIIIDYFFSEMQDYRCSLAI